jgi:hypothetical protein
MRGTALLSTAIAGSVAVMVGCSGAKTGATPTRKTNSDAGTSAAGGNAGGGSTAIHGGGAGGHGSAGITSAGRGGESGLGGKGGNSGSGVAGANGAAGGSAAGGGASGRGAGGASGAAGSGGTAAVSQSCTNAAHVLPLNPQNPQDGITLSGFYVDTDTWNAANYKVSQTMYVCDYGNWYVIANMNDDKHDGAVKTYPNVHKDFNAAPMISSFGSISSSFAHGGPHVGIYEFAYDIWLNGVAGSGSTEVMIWTDNYNQVPSGSVLDTVSYDGRSYRVYKSGSYIAFVDTDNVTSGTLNLLSFFNYIIGKGWIPASSTLGAIDYGVELVSTDGTDAKFELDDFSLVTN